MNNPHHGARLTVHSREQIVARVLSGQTAAEVAAAFAVSVRTVRKWMARFRAGGRAALANRASAPAHVARRMPGATLALIVHLRRSLQMTGAAIAARLGLSRSTVARWPRREGLGRLAQIDPPEPVRRYWERDRPIELRPVDMTHYFSRKKLTPAQNVWVRASAALPDDPRIHTCVLAYASDMTLLDTSLFAHGTSVFDPSLQVASLDHAMWFHRPFRADDWLLYAEDSPSASGGRGFTRGSLFSRDGALVASVAQEGLIRVRKERGDAS